MNTLSPKSKAPDFDLKDQNGQHVRRSDFIGKKLFLYFYPKANTSAWATQSKSVRDALEKLEEKNIAVVGISPDKPETQKKHKKNSMTSIILNFVYSPIRIIKLSKLKGFGVRKKLW